MLDTILKLAVGYIICKVLGGGGDFLESLFHHVKHEGPGPAPLPSPKPTMVNFPVVDPSGVPWPFGWRYVKNPGAYTQRAYALMAQLKDGERKVEQGEGGKWVTYYRTRDPKTGKIGVTVFEPKEQKAAASVPA